MGHTRQQMLLVEDSPCQHTSIEEIRAEGGALLGMQCSTCLAVLSGQGFCTGCGRERELHVYVDKTRQRFCSVDCKQQYRAAEQAKKDAAEDARRAREYAASIGSRR